MVVTLGSEVLLLALVRGYNLQSLRHLSVFICTVHSQPLGFCSHPPLKYFISTGGVQIKSNPNERHLKALLNSPPAVFSYLDLSVEAPRWRHVQDADVSGLPLPHAARPLPPQRLGLSLCKYPDPLTFTLPVCVSHRLSACGCSCALVLKCLTSALKVD